MSTEHEDRPSGEPDAFVAPGAIVGGKYRLLRRIGAGGMGEVWKALHTQLDDEVAIKILARALMNNDEAVGRFEREARILYKIRSSHVCRVLDVDGLPDGRPFMVMELLRGHDLATLLETGPKLDVELAVDLAVQLCEALAEAHVRHIVHRDLKPENIFLARGNDGGYLLKLVDFGLSKEREPSGRRERKLTHTQQVMGTPSYMAPEQWVSSTKVGPAADQWAVGTIIYEMLAGRPAFTGSNVAQICGQVMNGPTPSISRERQDVPRGLEAVLHKCLEKEPRRRYENVGALALALSAHGPAGSTARAERLSQVLSGVGAASEPDMKLPRLPVNSEMGATSPRLAGGRATTAHSWQTMALPVKSRRGYALLALVALAVLGTFAALGGLDEGAQESTASVPSESAPAVAAASRPPEQRSPESDEGSSNAEHSSFVDEADGTEEPTPKESSSDEDDREDRSAEEDSPAKPPHRVARPRPAPKEPPAQPGSQPKSIFDERW